MWRWKYEQGKNGRGLNNGNIKSNLSKPLFHYLISCSKGGPLKSSVQRIRSYWFTTGRDPYLGRINNVHNFFSKNFLFTWTFFYTLDSGINIGLRLLIFGFFPGFTSLSKRVIHKKILKFCYLMKWDMFFQVATFIVFPKCSRGYAYSGV